MDAIDVDLGGCAVGHHEEQVGLIWKWVKKKLTISNWSVEYFVFAVEKGKVEHNETFDSSALEMENVEGGK